MMIHLNKIRRKNFFHRVNRCVFSFNSRMKFQLGLCDGFVDRVLNQAVGDDAEAENA